MVEDALPTLRLHDWELHARSPSALDASFLIAGITEHPDSPWMGQMGRTMTSEGWGTAKSAIGN
jgi:hypothetical protein